MWQLADHTSSGELVRRACRQRMAYWKAREERRIVMDERRMGRVNEAGQKFAEALAGSYRAVSGRAASVQQLNAELTQNFFNSVINNLRSQAESNRQMTQELQGQQERQREATQALTQESVGAYMDFVNSMFSYYQGTVEQAGRQAQESQRRGHVEIKKKKKKKKKIKKK